MLITPSFKKSLIVEQFQGNYLKQLERRSLKKSGLQLIPPKLTSMIILHFSEFKLMIFMGKLKPKILLTCFMLYRYLKSFTPQYSYRYLF